MSYLDEMVKALRGAGTDALPFGVGGPAEPAVAAPQFVVDAIDSAATLPKRAIQNSQVAVGTGTYNPAVPMEAAMTLMGGGLPMAEKGAAGIFGGKLGVGADIGRLNKAGQMAADGMLPEEVIKSTGWHRSPADNLWRYEIPDNKSVMKYMPETEGNKAIGSLESLFHHPDAFKAYPQLRGQRLTLTKDSSSPRGSGLYSTDSNEMFVNAPDWRTARDVTLHELQHAVQTLEGFSPGANPQYYAAQIEKGLRSDPKWAGAYDYDLIKSKADELYRGTAGEVEARNVQARKDMPAFRRETVPPWATQDTPYLDQYHFDPVSETIRALRQR